MRTNDLLKWGSMKRNPLRFVRSAGAVLASTAKTFLNSRMHERKIKQVVTGAL